jgi:hypothetical protein
MPLLQRRILEHEQSIAAELPWCLTGASYAVVTRVGSGADACARTRRPQTA